MRCHDWIRDVDFEIVIVDDGSPDGTQEVVKQLHQVYGEDRIVSVSWQSKVDSFRPF